MLRDGDISAIAHDWWESSSFVLLINKFNKHSNPRTVSADYDNNPPHDVTFTPEITGTSGRLHSEVIRLLFLKDHRETDRFFPDVGV